MKFALIKTHNHSESAFPNIILESIEDALQYFNVEQAYISNQSIDILTDLQNNNRKTEDGTVKTLQFIIDTDKTGKDVTIPDLFYKFDTLRTKKFTTIANYIDKGEKIRISKQGGYCPIDNNMHEIVSEINIEPRQLIEYFINGTPQIFSFGWNPNQHQYLVLENQKEIGINVQNYIDQHNIIEQTCIVNNLLLKARDLDAFTTQINYAMRKGLTTLLIETSGLYVEQTKTLSEIIIKLYLQNPDKNLSVKYFSNSTPNFPPIPNIQVEFIQI